MTGRSLLPFESRKGENGIIVGHGVRRRPVLNARISVYSVVGGEKGCVMVIIMTTHMLMPVVHDTYNNLIFPATRLRGGVPRLSHLGFSRGEIGGC